MRNRDFESLDGKRPTIEELFPFRRVVGYLV